MKKTILILLLTVTTSAISQEVKIIEINEKNEYFDTGKSINLNEDNIDINNVYYVNGKLMNNLNDIKLVNPKAIKIFDIKKGEFIVDGITYEKKISITTYEKYKDNFLLTEEEYSGLKKPIKIVAKKL
ncbi:hypothetical protein ACPX19_13475 [Winogradskyella sp. HB-48]|uniref:hypothetical protein n=1 Tax=Winogradskyella sp. HB-48 TaxID=3416808 RepID=UPI003CEBA32A